VTLCKKCTVSQFNLPAGRCIVVGVEQGQLVSGLPPPTKDGSIGRSRARMGHVSPTRKRLKAFSGPAHIANPGPAPMPIEPSLVGGGDQVISLCPRYWVDVRQRALGRQSHFAEQIPSREWWEGIGGRGGGATPALPRGSPGLPGPPRPKMIDLRPNL
jgi:hypothetical protein